MAKTNYSRVLEIEPQHPQGLGFLGMVYHHLEDTDQAIVKYHEVGSDPRLYEPSLTDARR
jgi:anaphase-promoting complex subunit 6